MILTYQGAESYTFETVDPFAECPGVYWIAENGQCYALRSDNACLAVVEHAVSDHIRATTELHPYRRVYVIWQPKNHSKSVWERWVSKWSKRTATATA